MKYSDIKVGDEVYVMKCVTIGWSNKHYFWVPRKVEKVTPKRFVVAGNTYAKVDGREVGNSNYALNLGDPCGVGVVTNQVREKNILVASKKNHAAIKDMLYDFEKIVA